MPTLVLVRHGESEWNSQNRFTGWIDVDLTVKGKQESLSAGQRLKEKGLTFDVVYTSLLKRTIVSAFYILQALDQLWIPVKKCWELNERHYGLLQGKDKAEAALEYGKDQIQKWRRGFSERPPQMPTSHPNHPFHDARYQQIKPEFILAGESLENTLVRVLRLWHEQIWPDLKDGKKVLIVAHGNSIRALMKHLHRYKTEDIESVDVPTGVPIVYELTEKFEIVSYYKLEENKI